MISRVKVRKAYNSWENRAQAFYYLLLTSILIFVCLVLWIIYKHMVLNYDLEKQRLQQADRTGITAPASSSSGGSSNTHADTQNGRASAENTLEFIERFVIAESNKRQSEGRGSLVPKSLIDSLINALIGSGGLTEEAKNTVSDLRKELTKAASEVGVDTIKKITTKLLESKPTEKKQDKAQENAAFQNNLNINLSCSSERAQAQAQAQAQKKITQVKPHLPSGQQMVCPVPLVPKKLGAFKKPESTTPNGSFSTGDSF
jgi:hypothetical protein